MTSTRHLTATRMICVPHNTGCSFTYRNIDYWPVKMSAHSQWNIYLVCLCDFIPTCRWSRQSQLSPLLYLSHCWISATDSWSLLFFFFKTCKRCKTWTWNLPLRHSLITTMNSDLIVWTNLPSTDNLSTEPRGPVWAGGSVCWGSRRLRRHSSGTGSAPLSPGWGRRPVRCSPSSRGSAAPKGRRSGISQPVTTAYVWCFVSCWTNEECLLSLA